jgi:hypothetical protein
MVHNRYESTNVIQFEIHNFYQPSKTRFSIWILILLPFYSIQLPAGSSSSNMWLWWQCRSCRFFRIWNVEWNPLYWNWVLATCMLAGSPLSERRAWAPLSICGVCFKHSTVGAHWHLARLSYGNDLR